MNEYFLNIKTLLTFWDIIRRKDFMLGRAVREIETKFHVFSLSRLRWIN